MIFFKKGVRKVSNSKKQNFQEKARQPFKKTK